MQASGCANQGRQREEQAAPPPQKKNRGGRGGARKQPTATKPPANTTRGGQTPPPEGTKDRTPEEARGDRPAKTGNTKPGTAAHREKGHRNMQTHTTKKKKSQQPSPKERGWGDRDLTARDRDTQQKKRKSAKNTPRQPSHEGLGTAETQAQRARPHRTPGWARTKPHTSQMQAETEPQPRTPQTADTRGTTPQTVPKHTHPRPQPGLAGLTKPTPNRNPDPNTNAAQH